MKNIRIFPCLLALCLLLSACGGTGSGDTAATDSPEATASTPAETPFGGMDPAELFPEEPEEETPEQSPAPSDPPSVETEAPAESEPSAAETPNDGKAYIYLDGDTATCASNAVRIETGRVTILDEGTYVLSGTYNGTIVVDADKKDETCLELNGVTLYSDTFAALYALKAKSVTVRLAAGTVNTLSNGGSFVQTDDNSVDAVIFSKTDLILSGSGALAVTSPAGHGIVSKDELIVTGGSYAITAASHGMEGKDDLCIKDGTFAVTAGKDALRAENTEDGEKGFVQIEGGTFTLSAEGDGISASAWMCINGGSFDIVTGGGAVNGEQQTSEGWGGFGGGPGGGMGGPGGGMPGGPGGRPGGQSSGSTTQTTEEDSTSIKGIKASGSLTVNGGSFTLDCADDALHSNADLSLCGGTFQIATGDDGFHADAGLYVSGGSVTITESYEGLEGLFIEFSGGTVELTAADDGLNAAGGSDQSGFGGHRGGDMFAADDNSYITISGGTLSIRASGDGIDSNGALTISGGAVTVCGPTNGDTAVLDYGSTGTISGGTFIGTGAYMMAQTFSQSVGQGVIAVSVGNQSAGTEITLTDGDGNVVLRHTPALSYAIVILSSPDIVKGETYTITVGSASGSFEAN